MHTVEQLVAFVAVYTHGSYSAASKALGKSRSTVREQIQAFEDALGYSLFSIEGKKATPTSNASKLIKRSRILVKQHQTLFTQGLELFTDPTSEITISYDTLTPIDLIADVDGFIRNNWPLLSINWIHRNREQSLNGVLAKEYDIAILPSLGNAFSEKEVTWSKLGIIYLSIYTAANSPLVSEKEITLEQLCLEPQLICEAQADLDINLRGMAASPCTNTISNNDLLCAILKNTGWAILPKLYASPFVESGMFAEVKLNELGHGTSIELNAFHLHGKEQGQHMNSILKFMRNWFNR